MKLEEEEEEPLYKRKGAERSMMRPLFRFLAFESTSPVLESPIEEDEKHQTAFHTLKNELK